jgi:hypothetical protein
MTTELRDLEITAVALVDNPANPMATVELFKMAAEPDQEGATVPQDTVAKSDHDTVVAELESAKAELAALTDMSNDDLAALRGIEVVKAEEETEDVLKGLPEDVRKRLEDAEARVEKMERDNRVSAFKKQAEDDFGKIAPADELGVALEEIDRVAPGAAKTVNQVLKAIAARVDTSDLFKELGTSGDAGAENEAEAAIAAEVAKGMSRVDAIKKVFTDRPELYPAAQNA